MTTIQIYLYSDGSTVIRTHGVDSHRVRSLIRLAGPNPEKLRAYIAEALHIVPEVIHVHIPVPPPSGPMVAGE